jgi:uncharacterized membrane protein
MNLRKEFPLLLIVALPVIYLGYIYPSLAETVPLHWNAQGEIDDWGPKSTLWLIPFILPFLMYILMSVIPVIDPKGKIKQMGTKFYQLKFILIVCMSALALYIIYAAQTQTIGSLKGIFLLIGALIAALGNYMPSLKPNYFMGIRTPWTLESEVVWKKTHRLTGKIWLVGGLVIMVLALLVAQEHLLAVLLIITAIITIIPLIYSYVLFKSEEKTRA